MFGDVTENTQLTLAKLTAVRDLLKVRIYACVGMLQWLALDVHSTDSSCASENNLQSTTLRYPEYPVRRLTPVYLTPPERLQASTNLRETAPLIMSNRPPKDPSEGGTKEFLAFPKTRIEREGKYASRQGMETDH